MWEKHSSEVYNLLTAAGWTAGRRVAQPEDSLSNRPTFAAAQEVLSEFNGLHIGECGPGVDCATSDMQIDPRLTTHLSDELRQYEHSLGTKLFALGEVHRGHGYLVIDEQGRTYLLSDELEPLASSFSQGLEKLLLGRKSL